ncbi:MAG: hypothetical protein NWF00_12355 [Candidatus Bathyarchaeota archaeon]|nr:hypothetical protein [Candidatus Bathyarchaeota archaeon]
MSKLPKARKLKSARLPLIKCECGAEILVVPDVKVMSECIEMHLMWHKQKIYDPAQARLEAERIREGLIEQILKIACQQGEKEKEEY